MKLTLFSQPLTKLKTDLAVIVVDTDTTLGAVEDPDLRRVLNEVRKGFKEERFMRSPFLARPHRAVRMRHQSSARSASR